MKIGLTSLVSLILFFQVATGQKMTIHGKVVNEKKNALKYVNIGIPGKSIGTVSDDNGYFNLSIDQQKVSEEDSLKFSLIGYNSKSFLLNNILPSDSSFQIELQQKAEELKEVLITTNKYLRKTIGTGHKSLINMVVNFSIPDSPDQNLGSQIGRKFSIGKSGAKIESFSFYISQNNYDNVKFRINIYSIKNGKPGVSILKENIYLDIKNKQTGWINIELLPYEIIVNKDVIVAVEWISKSNTGNRLSLPITFPTSHVHFYKFGSQNYWKRRNSMTSLMKLTYLY